MPTAHPASGRRHLALSMGLLLAGLLLAASSPAAPSVVTTTVSGPITPVTEQHLAAVIERAAAEDHTAVVVTLDTPGGGLAPTRGIVQTILDAPVPVVVHVAPRGADAGSAGTFITLAAHVAAMAPATTIGAATPVGLEGQDVGDKVVENTVAFARALAELRGRDVDFAVDAVREGRSVTADTARELGVVELVVEPDELLDQLDGREVEVRGEGVVLDTAGARVVEHGLPVLRRLLQVLADPNLAFILLSLGTLGILYEIASPGLGLGGVVGGVALVLALFSLSVLPVNIAGLVLMALAAAMFIGELFAPGIGVGAAGGTIALVLSGLFLFQGPTGLGVDWWVLIPTVVVTAGATVLAGVLAARTRHVQPVEGSDDLLGREAEVERADGQDGRVRVYGTWWRVHAARPDTPLREGQRVRIVARENIDLLVEPVEEHEHGT